MVRNNDLKRRIIELSYKHKLSHLSSCLTAVDIIDEIYQTKEEDEKFVLSAGHAGLALYVILEKYEGHDAEDLLLRHGVHPNREPESGIWVSTGSLGQGLPIAVGMAMADRSKNVYCLISDGEAHEGSIYESLNFIDDYDIKNCKVYVNWNGYTAYREPSEAIFDYLKGMDGLERVQVIFTNLDDYKSLHGLEAHYKVLNEEEYNEIMKELK